MSAGPVCDMPDWQLLDSLDGAPFGLESSVINNELHQRQFSDNLGLFGLLPSQIYSPDGFMQHELNHELQEKSPDFFFHPLQTDMGIRDGRSQQSHSFQGHFSPGGIPEEQNHFSPSLDDLLRSTSQLATERALYMNAPMTSTPLDGAFPQTPFTPNFPPLLDPCSSPATSQSNNGSEDDQDLEIANFNFYSLPDGFPRSTPRQPLASDNTEDCLTPLEMPDGTTRLTSNWLPVDPEGGFTIGGPYDDNPLDMDPLAYGKNAFISADISVSNFAV
ncbi:hypothetical protein ASPWEDRAFT_169743 [Aspergillus wentii DTO 134E9]|uniref:Uncharacterized protein n=1 Tax=Aspergillus wentii DTO 134E9 TaxID=1073089 RepID=A0A1L9RYB2_ASPWE|nr:uncharacterized protein ASPWEDRAFT_169743 [Aspergillus wentii DTO 134E9]KAI9931412.1 hypothetical protein MW887_009987 [Aspergillus wentii]OJJ39919.1 hypothetical protein ASPWEDRAFT_169743 [Aspergillus wentii DTO 134E9]